MIIIHMKEVNMLVIVPVTFVLLVSAVAGENLEKPTLQKDFPTKCYKRLGCFETGPPFYNPPHRPISLLPFEKLDTEFLLYTPKRPTQPQKLSFDANVRESDFDPYLPLKVFVPGYTFIDANMTNLIWGSFLRTGSYNMLIANWSSSNQAAYGQAVANGRVVAAELAYLLKNLTRTFIVNPKSIHLIGHSLGAHIAGWVGKKMSGIGRITGLDPAGPYFYEADPRVRLDADDAVFVDVIYTNTGSNYVEGLGLNENIGHLNFYPNGGLQQPGCYNEDDIDALKDFDPVRNSCSHARAFLLFLMSLQGESCQFWGTPCDAYKELDHCRRTAPRIRMGLQATKSSINRREQNIYLKTSASLPFCISE